ncbi:MAG: D-alanyl-D-alanine carboxypeptidase [Alphaproteobacteria bacterium]|nr:D-alanyl-D-alanine carboxypeptidase [Alphaproteobacteria bacterium]
MRSIFIVGILGLLAALEAKPVSAGPALLFEASNGKVLYAEDADQKWHPASLTKIMTAYLTFQALKDGKFTLKSKIKCTPAAHRQQPSKIGLPIGAEMTVDLALQALIVKSANDVAVMLAEAVAGSEPQFIARMNATATRLGMTQTNFVNPNGLPALQQVTTARDMALLAQAVARDFPEYAHYWKQPSFRIGKKRLRSYNGLLKTFAGADGMKTGFICDSGYNVVASATRDGRRLMAVVLGEPTGSSRTIRAASLLEHGFQSYGWKQLFNTLDLKNMPKRADSGAVTSVRHTVASWACNPHKARRAKKKRRKKRKGAIRKSAKKRIKVKKP